MGQLLYLFFWCIYPQSLPLLFHLVPNWSLETHHKPNTAFFYISTFFRCQHSTWWQLEGFQTITDPDSVQVGPENLVGNNLRDRKTRFTEQETEALSLSPLVIQNVSGDLIPVALDSISQTCLLESVVFKLPCAQDSSKFWALVLGRDLWICMSSRPLVGGGARPSGRWRDSQGYFQKTVPALCHPLSSFWSQVMFVTHC